MSITLQQFADTVDCHMSMASRLRSGERLPSAKLLFRISRAYRIPLTDLREAHEQGEQAFAELLKTRVFDRE